MWGELAGELRLRRESVTSWSVTSHTGISTIERRYRLRLRILDGDPVRHIFGCRAGCPTADSRPGAHNPNPDLLHHQCHGGHSTVLQGRGLPAQVCKDLLAYVVTMHGLRAKTALTGYRPLPAWGTLSDHQCRLPNGQITIMFGHKSATRVTCTGTRHCRSALGMLIA